MSDPQKVYLLPDHDFVFLIAPLLKSGRVQGSLHLVEGTDQYGFATSEPQSWMQGWETTSAPLLEVDTFDLLIKESREIIDPLPRTGVILVFQDFSILAKFFSKYIKWKTKGISLLERDEEYFLKLDEPSIWVLEESREKLHSLGVPLYFQWGQIQGLYWSEDQDPKDPPINLLPSGIFLIPKDQKTLRLPTEGWTPLNHFLHVVPPPISKEPEKEPPKLKVTLGLAKSALEQETVALKGRDKQVLFKAAERFSWSALSDINVLFGPDSSYYLFKREESSLWSYLKERLQSFSLLGSRFYYPTGYRIIPAFYSEEIEALFHLWELDQANMLFLEPGEAGARLVQFDRFPQTLTEWFVIQQVRRWTDSASGKDLEEQLAEYVIKAAVNSPEPGPQMHFPDESQGAPRPESAPKNEKASQEGVSAKVTAPQYSTPEQKEETKIFFEGEDEKAVSSEESYSAPTLPQEFLLYEKKTEQYLTDESGRLVLSARRDIHASEPWLMLSAVHWFLGERTKSLQSWAQGCLCLQNAARLRFWEHPFWEDTNLSEDFTEAYNQIESFQLPGEVNYMAMSFLGLQHNKRDTYTMIQKALYQDYFQGKAHPILPLFRNKKESVQFQARWEGHQQSLWQKVLQALPASLAPMAEAQMQVLLKKKDLIPGKTPVMPSAPNIPAAILQAFTAWAEKAAIDTRPPEDQDRSLLPWLEVLRGLEIFNPETDEPSDLLFFLPKGVPFDQILKRYQGKLQSGITDRKTFFPGEENPIQRIINNQILYDLSRVFGILVEFKPLIPPVLSDSIDEPLDLVMAIQILRLHLLYQLSPAEVLRRSRIPALISALAKPGNNRDLQSWNTLLALIWESPLDEKQIYLPLICTQFKKVLGDSPMDAALWVNSLKIITIIQGSLLFSSLSENMEEVQDELRRQSLWVQEARSNLKKDFETLRKSLED